MEWLNLSTLHALQPSSVLAGCLAGDAFAQVSEAPMWNSKAAAAYLDQRSTWWMNWPASARDHGTFCISCHTVAPYALGRSALRGALAERSVSPNEQKLLGPYVWHEAWPVRNSVSAGSRWYG